jgi:hypothetical protein
LSIPRSLAPVSRHSVTLPARPVADGFRSVTDPVIYGVGVVAARVAVGNADGGLQTPGTVHGTRLATSPTEPSPLADPDIRNVPACVPANGARKAATADTDERRACPTCGRLRPIWADCSHCQRTTDGALLDRVHASGWDGAFTPWTADRRGA